VKYIKIYEEVISDVDTELEEIIDISHETIIIHGWNVY